jgi:hypothetical protein
MSKKISGVVALVGLCALSLFLLNCGSSSSRPAGILYVLTQGSTGIGNNVNSYAIDLGSGSLSFVNANASTCPTQASQDNPEPCGLPLDILLDPTGATAYVLNQGAPVCPACGPGGNNPIAPSIYPYTVNSDGSLSNPGTAVNWTTYPDSAVAMTRDAAGQFLFVIDHGSYPEPLTCPAIGTAASSADVASTYAGCPSISVLAMPKPPSTTLTFVSQSSTYQSPFFLSKTPSALSAITFTPPGGAAQELLFVSNNYDLCTVACSPQTAPNDNTVSVYSVSSSGVLSEQPFSPYAVAAVNPISVQAVYTNPAGENSGGLFVYVGNEDPNGGHLYPFEVCTVVGNANCTQAQVTENLMSPLTTCPQLSCQVPPTSAGQSPVAMVVDPTNNFLYVVAQGTSQVFGFRISAAAGTLTALSPASYPTGSGAQPGALALHPSVNNTGQFLYVSNSNSSNIMGFALNTTSGSMSSPITINSLPTPSGMAAR